MDDLSDPELLALAADGDERSFAALFDRHSRSVLRYALTVTSTSADAQELLQETFITAWKKAGSVRLVDGSILPWLFVVCRNAALNLRRYQMRHHTTPLDQVPDQADQKSQVEDIHAIDDLFAHLTPSDRRLCELCLIEGYSYAEAAKVIGVSVGVVGKRLERARGRLRKALGQ